LALVTIVVNGIALSAIFFRISEWGMTPNRFAVMGANILILINLCIVAFRLSRYSSANAEVSDTRKLSVENAISNFLPVYIAWAAIVIFIFPFLFQFK
jgi:hypothetical protein